MELNDWLAIIGAFGGIGGCPLGCHVLGEPQDERTERGCVRRFNGG